MAELEQRAASLADIKGVWQLFKETAADIPLDLQSEAAQESILTEVMVSLTYELSPIIVDENKTVVAALLVRRDDFDWGFLNSKALHLTYAALAPSQKDQGVLPKLVAQVQEQGVPVLASVKKGNTLNFAEELQKLGFVLDCTAESGWGELYKWTPPTPSA